MYFLQRYSLHNIRLRVSWIHKIISWSPTTCDDLGIPTFIFQRDSNIPFRSHTQYQMLDSGTQIHLVNFQFDIMMCNCYKRMGKDANHFSKAITQIGFFKKKIKLFCIYSAYNVSFIIEHIEILWQMFHDFYLIF